MHGRIKKKYHGKKEWSCFLNLKSAVILSVCSQVAGQPHEETAALLELPPHRIGHGTFIHPSLGGTEELSQTVIKHSIPLGKGVFIYYQGRGVV